MCCGKPGGIFIILNGMTDVQVGLLGLGFDVKPWVDLRLAPLAVDFLESEFDCERKGLGRVSTTICATGSMFAWQVQSPFDLD